MVNLITPCWIRLRNGLMTTIVSVVHLVNNSTKQTHICWDDTLTNEISFVLYENPFDCTFVVSLNVHEPAVILPNWFQTVVYHEDGDTHEEGEDTYSMKLDNGRFYVKRGKESFEIESDNNSRFLEVHLEGTDKSLFKYHYPLGINITPFGNLMYGGGDEEEGGGNRLKLYEMVPFLLYNICQKVIPYDRESFRVILLEDDTFDLYKIDWDGVEPVLVE